MGDLWSEKGGGPGEILTQRFYNRLISNKLSLEVSQVHLVYLPTLKIRGSASTPLCSTYVYLIPLDVII